MTKAVHSVFSDVLVRVVEVQELQSVSGTQFGPDLKQRLELRHSKQGFKCRPQHQDCTNILNSDNCNHVFVH